MSEPGDHVASNAVTTPSAVMATSRAQRARPGLGNTIELGGDRFIDPMTLVHLPRCAIDKGKRSSGLAIAGHPVSRGAVVVRAREAPFRK